MTKEEKLELEERRKTMRGTVEEDINLMDEVLASKTDFVSEVEEAETGEVESEAEPAVIASEEATPADLQTEEDVGTSDSGEDEEEYDFTFINDLAKQAISGKPEQVSQIEKHVAKPEPTVSADPTPAPTPTQVLPKELVSIEEMEKAFESPQEMIALLGRVVQKVREESVQEALLRLPQAVRPVIQQEASTAKLVEQFRAENPHLTKHPDFVKYCAIQIENAHPDWTAEKVMKETARVATKQLQIFKEAAQRQKAGSEKPSFVSQKQSGRKKPSSVKLSALEQDIANMPDAF